MSDKKHIDRLFQEKLKDFEAIPSDAIWKSIENKLHDKKRKRRVIPIWWQMAGVAAVLVLLLTLGNLVSNTAIENDSTKNPVVNTEEKNKISDPTSETNSISKNSQDENVDLNEVKEEDPSSNDNLNQKENNIVTLANTKTNSNQSNGSQNTNTKINKALNNTKYNPTITSNTKVDNGVKSSNLPELNQIKKETAEKYYETEELFDVPKNDIRTAVSDNQAEDNVPGSNEEPIEKEFQSIEEAIAQANNTIEKEESEKLSRWNVSTNVAPVYFNSLGEGSTLGDQFNGNSKSGEINMSYGLNGSYSINDKLKIRAGINKVNLGYNTNDVIISTGAGITSNVALSRNNGNIDFNDKNENTSIISTQNLSFATVPEILASNVKATINQELGFIEFPIEMEYAISNKKLGLNVIGGFSTFFLNNNKVYSALNGDKSLLGEAKNINGTSYSANFGLGLNYNVSEKIKFNLEPTFKYQINTFRDTSGDFQPYFIGIYTGLSYKF